MTSKRRLLIGGLLLATAGAASAWFARDAHEPSETLVVERVTSTQAAPDPGAHAAAPAPGRTHAMEESARRQLATLEDVLRTRNDNDPRLDRELRVLSRDAREAFRDKYRMLRPEALNDRGTIVFLLGRNLKSPADFDFMRDVLLEPPCLSLADCSRIASGPGGNEDEVGAVGVTLAYPQIVAVRSLERSLSGLGEANRGSAAYRHAWDALTAATRSPIPRIARMAREAQKRWPAPGA